MPLHLLKLCVGAESVQDLEEWIAEDLARKSARGEAVEQFHTTRMVPNRLPELIDGGSLYWVVKGEVACRQRLLAIRPFVDTDGIRRCHLVLEPVVRRVEPRPCRPFQGWRYLAAKDAPLDMGDGPGDVALPETLRRELRTLGLL
ncbi:DUF1489 family protein [Ancylobacter radicis]|uniref:DUF1489 domain-containing protein n=1 Tax=Ancylobacter radicis TaxID=2836179 RepID=A0ABS5R4Q5_9HYPH|nr:DUF1489 family protein [Ancylobacter radicis]MBS9476633.1 DUF1489 domain-containing protein [Ancylobacter radicis]